MGFARGVAQKTVFMHQGRIWEYGASSELFSAPRTDELRSFIKSDVK
jgi:polar amino acid transport system ATP-binding protein